MNIFSKTARMLPLTLYFSLKFSAETYFFTELSGTKEAGVGGSSPPIILNIMVLRHNYNFDVLFSIVLRTRPPPPQSAAAFYSPKKFYAIYLTKLSHIRCHAKHPRIIRNGEFCMINFVLSQIPSRI